MKLKNFCPVPVGGVLPMWNETNPTNLYLGTTWELLTTGKYIQSGNTALSTGGTNYLSISKANLPNIKLSVNTFSATISDHNHNLRGYGGGALRGLIRETPCIAGISESGYFTSGTAVNNTMQKAGGGNTGNVSPSTESLGSGTALTIQPAYITLKFWKRTS